MGDQQCIRCQLIKAALTKVRAEKYGITCKDEILTKKLKDAFILFYVYATECSSMTKLNTEKKAFVRAYCRPVIQTCNNC